MVKIPISEVNWFGGERYVTHVLIEGKNFRFHTNVIIDTGSPWSIIMETDLKTKTRIPYTSYPIVKRVNVIVPVDLIDLGKCTLKFHDVEDKIVSFEHNMFGGRITQRNIEFIQALPSILGKDFLDEHNLFIGKRDDSGRRYLQD